MHVVTLCEAFKPSYLVRRLLFGWEPYETVMTKLVVQIFSYLKELFVSSSRHLKSNGLILMIIFYLILNSVFPHDIEEDHFTRTQTIAVCLSIQYFQY